MSLARTRALAHRGINRSSIAIAAIVAGCALTLGSAPADAALASRGTDPTPQNLSETAASPSAVCQAPEAKASSSTVEAGQNVTITACGFSLNATVSGRYESPKKQGSLGTRTVNNREVSFTSPELDAPGPYTFFIASDAGDENAEVTVTVKESAKKPPASTHDPSPSPSETKKPSHTPQPSPREPSSSPNSPSNPSTSHPHTSSKPAPSSTSRGTGNGNKTSPMAPQPSPSTAHKSAQGFGAVGSEHSQFAGKLSPHDASAEKVPSQQQGSTAQPNTQAGTAVSEQEADANERTKSMWTMVRSNAASVFVGIALIAATVVGVFLFNRRHQDS